MLLLILLQVSLARLILKKPKLLCLDEPTAFLDAVTEAKFLSLLEEHFSQTTILCISNRIDTMVWCKDRIELLNGRVVRISDSIRPRS
jgi:ABC-type multidrug transport system fused ATPase/permease subunit